MAENIVKTICPDTALQEFPVVKFVAELVERMQWDPNRFKIYTDAKIKRTVVDVFRSPTEVHGHVLDGYSYAKQVKFVMDSVERAGFLK